MSTVTGISWTDHTFNPWWGCTKVSEACRGCYAERDAKRFRPDVTLWGPGSMRQGASEATLHEPRKWFRKARAAGVRRRVFCASMADVFEDHPTLPGLRAHLWSVILETVGDARGGLDWLLLTKRPENVRAMVPSEWLLPGGWPSHVWVGTTAETQERADERLPKLLEVPARVLFVSAEPLLGWLDLRAYLGPGGLSWVIVAWLDDATHQGGAPWRARLVALARASDPLTMPIEKVDAELAANWDGVAPRREGARARGNAPEGSACLLCVDELAQGRDPRAAKVGGAA